MISFVEPRYFICFIQMEEKVKEIVEIKQRSLAEENQKTVEVLKDRYFFSSFYSGALFAHVNELFVSFSNDPYLFTRFSQYVSYLACFDDFLFLYLLESSCCKISFDKPKIVFPICKNYTNLLKARCSSFVLNQVIC